MIIRVVSPKGTKRVEISENENVNKLLEKVQQLFGLSPSEKWHISKTRDGLQQIVAGSVKTYSIKQGDQIFLVGGLGSMNGGAGGEGVEAMDCDVPSDSACSLPGPSWRNNDCAGSALNSSPLSKLGEEDEVDKILAKMDGKIYRKPNDQLCRHGASGKCIHCVPLEPYDENYLSHCDPPIKFMSFHAYLKKLQGGSDKGKFVFLENPSCRIKAGCKEHLPWPEGICTKCQPNAVTLNIQKYRYVDYVQFENRDLMEKFLDYFRKTGHQRIGYLYGKYTTFDNAPLGIKAVVSAIYEPPQITSPKSVQLVTGDESEERAVENLSRQLGLCRVGWIFTDLVADDLQKGTVKHHRGTQETFFLSAQECITAAHFQNKHPSVCKASSDGYFGSKFVTVVVTGDSSNQIHFEGYQVSNQCMALQKDGCIVPTYDAPELGYIKESSNEQYVPDVFYSTKDKYGNEVTKLGRPLPVEYLLTDMPAAFPIEEQHTLFAPIQRSKPIQFPAEHRQSLGLIQDFPTFARYMNQFPSAQHLAALSNFHVLFFLSTCDMLPLRDHMDNLIAAIKDKDPTVIKSFFDSEEWQTVLTLMQHAEDMPSSAMHTESSSGLAASGASSGASWSCNHCTYLNSPTSSSCEMCNLPST